MNIKVFIEEIFRSVSTFIFGRKIFRHICYLSSQRSTSFWLLTIRYVKRYRRKGPLHKRTAHDKEWTLLNKIKRQMTNKRTLEVVISFSYFDFDGRYRCCFWFFNLFIYSSSLFLKVKIERILAILNGITEGLKCHNFLDAVKKIQSH